MAIVSVPEPVAVVHSRTTYAFHQPRTFRHPYHIFGLRVRGEGSYRLGSTELPSGGQFASLLAANEDDANGLVGPSESWWVGFRWPGARIVPDGDDLRLRWQGRWVRTPRWKPLAPDALARLTDDFAAMRAANQRGDLAGQLAARAMLLRALAYYLDLAADREGTPTERALVAFRSALEKHACDPLRIAELARRSGLSPDHLRELFAARYGQRPQEFREAIRLARARELLMGTARTVKEAAASAGYADPLYFSRAFRRRFGVSPLEILRRYRPAPAS